MRIMNFLNSLMPPYSFTVQEEGSGSLGRWWFLDGYECVIKSGPFDDPNSELEKKDRWLESMTTVHIH